MKVRGLARKELCKKRDLEIFIGVSFSLEPNSNIHLQRMRLYRTGQRTTTTEKLTTRKRTSTGKLAIS